MGNLRTKYLKPALAVLIVLLLIGNSFIQRGLNQARSDMGLTRLEPLENAPPILAFTTVALGGFRGLIANLLWIRATQLQDDGRYFEMVQLADWITTLQPHFTTVWVHQAWNMSYNISVKFPNHEDRWQWIQRGIELLRDQGLQWNPQETLIYRELSWHFQHKMGHNLDDAHMTYKIHWAQEWDQILGGGGRPNFDALLNPQTPEEKEAVRIIRERHKMDPAIMKEVDEMWGPFEWRLPDAHAIYWAHLGLKISKVEKDMMTLRRSIYQSMQMAFDRGRLVEYRLSGPENDEGTNLGFEFGPNLALTSKVNAAYEQMMEEEPDKADHIGTGHKNFLRLAVWYLYTHNRGSEANSWFDYLEERYPDATQGKSMEEFAFLKVEEEFSGTSHNKTISNIQAYIRQSLHYVATGQPDRAIGAENIATWMKNRFNEEIDGSQAERLPLNTIRNVKVQMLAEFLDPANGFDSLLQAALRTELPNLAKEADQFIADHANRTNAPLSLELEGPPAPQE